MILRHAALALALAAAATTAHAGIRASAINPYYWTGTADETYLPLTGSGAVTLSFNLPSAGKKVLTFSAVCQVRGPGGSMFYNDAHLDLDIYVNGVRVALTTPGINPTPDDAFCSKGYTPEDGFGPLTRASITVPIQGNAGNNAVQIKVRGQAGATGLFLARTSLVIYD